MSQNELGGDQAVERIHIELWNRWRDRRDESARNELVEIYLPFARTIAAKQYTARGSDVLDFDDYMQFATIGLIESVENFDPHRSARFETFASYRVRGAILNGLEQGSERLAQRAYRRRYMRDRVESIGEGFYKDQDAKLFKEMVQAAIGLAFGYLLEDSQLGATPEAQQDNPYKQLEVNRLKQRLQSIVAGIPDKERQVVSYHYFEHYNFSEIATLMKLTKGRVSQLHSRALLMIREAYEEADNFNVRY